MDGINNDISNNSVKKQSIREGMVHIILSHSYTVFLMAVVFGLVLDVFIPIYIFNAHIYQYIGIIFIVLGSLLIYWAQSTTSFTKKEEVQNSNAPRDFARGPYKYSRNPTHIGLSIMTLGLGLLLNSVFSVVLTVIASLITKFIFVKKEETILQERYGQSYSDYKKKVGTWV